MNIKVNQWYKYNNNLIHIYAIVNKAVTIKVYSNGVYAPIGRETHTMRTVCDAANGWEYLGDNSDQIRLLYLK